MLKIDRANGKCERLSVKTLAQAKILERYDLQKMIVNNPDPFLEEMGERVVLIGEEVRPSEVVNDSIDLLAIDENGAAVIIELKRADQKFQLLQALSYAAMLAEWDADDFSEQRQTFAKEEPADARDAIADRLVNGKLTELNRSQRIVLLAEDFDYTLLKTAEWLREKYDLSIRCYRVGYTIDGPAEFLSVTRVYPPPEITDHALRVKRLKPAQVGTEFSTWEEALTTVQNDAVRSFFVGQLPFAEKRLKVRDVAIRIHGVRRYWVTPRRQHAYVWQRGRFDGDVQYWQALITQPHTVEPVENSTCLRFNLVTKADFAAFESAVTGQIQSTQFNDDQYNPPAAVAEVAGA